MRQGVEGQARARSTCDAGIPTPRPNTPRDAKIQNPKNTNRQPGGASLLDFLVTLRRRAIRPNIGQGDEPGQPDPPYLGSRSRSKLGSMRSLAFIVLAGLSGCHPHPSAEEASSIPDPPEQVAAQELPEVRYYLIADT